MTHQTIYNKFVCVVQSILVNDYFIITVIHLIIVIALIMLQLYTQTQDISITAHCIYEIFNRAQNILKNHNINDMKLIFFFNS